MFCLPHLASILSQSRGDFQRDGAQPKRQGQFRVLVEGDVITIRVTVSEEHLTKGLVCRYRLQLQGRLHCSFEADNSCLFCWQLYVSRGALEVHFDTGSTLHADVGIGSILHVGVVARSNLRVGVVAAAAAGVVGVVVGGVAGFGAVGVVGAADAVDAVGVVVVASTMALQSNGLA